MFRLLFVLVVVVVLMLVALAGLDQEWGQEDRIGFDLRQIVESLTRWTFVLLAAMVVAVVVAAVGIQGLGEERWAVKVMNGVWRERGWEEAEG